MNEDDIVVKSGVIGEQQKVAVSRNSGGTKITYSYVQFSDHSHSLRRQTQGNHGSRNTVALVKSEKEGSVFSGAKARDVIRHPPPGSSYTYLGQKHI